MCPPARDENGESKRASPLLIPRKHSSQGVDSSNANSCRGVNRPSHRCVVRSVGILTNCLFRVPRRSTRTYHPRRPSFGKRKYMQDFYHPFEVYASDRCCHAETEKLPLCNKTSASRLLELPTALLLLVFRFFSVEELPRIAAAAPQLWRMLLRGELLQRESSIRLHSGRRWLKGGFPASFGDTRGSNSSTSCCSVIPVLLAKHAGRIKRLSFSSRVLEPVPPVCLLLALKEQSSSLQQLLISSADSCSQGLPTRTEGPSVAADAGNSLDGMSLDSLASPRCSQRLSATTAYKSEAEELGATTALQEEAVEAAACVLAGSTFEQLKHLRVQGCQAFLWLRLFSRCSFPNCKVLTVACSCIRQHTVPPPHGPAAVAGDLLRLVRTMMALQCLHLEMALPPTRCFWRGLLFPMYSQMQSKHTLRQLRISESVFLNLAEVLEEAKMQGLNVAATGVPGGHHSIHEIFVVAAQRRLHPATMPRLLAASGSADATASSYSIRSEFVEVRAMTANSRTMLQLLQHASDVRLILGDREATSDGEEDTVGAVTQNGTVLPQVTPRGFEPGVAGPQLPRIAGQKPPQQHQEEDLITIYSPASAAAVNAAQLCKVAVAAQRVALDIRDDALTFHALRQTACERGEPLCHCTPPEIPEAPNQRRQKEAGASQEADCGYTSAPSFRVVGLPASVENCCSLSWRALSEEPPGCRVPIRCRFCGCLSQSPSGPALTSSTESSRDRESWNSNAGSRGVCVCLALQACVIPLLHLVPSFLLAHSGGGTSRWGADSTTALLQSDLLLLRQVCCSELLRSHCIGVEAEAAGQTLQQRRSFYRFLSAAVELPETLRPPLRLLRLSLLSDRWGPCCVSGEVKINGRTMKVLLTMLQQYPLLQRVEITAPLYLRDPAEEPAASREPLALLQVQHMLQQQGFQRRHCSSKGAFRHVFVFTKAPIHMTR